MKSILASELDDILLENLYVDENSNEEEELDTIESTKLNPYQQNLVDRSKTYLPEYREHMFDSIFGEGNDRIYLEDRLEVKVNPKSKDVENLIDIINGCISALNSLNNKSTYDEITMDNFASGTTTKHVKQIRGIKNSEVSLTTILSLAKDIYNKVLDDEWADKDTDETKNFKKFFVPINVRYRNYDRDLKQTLDYFNRINPSSILDPEHKLKVVISKNYEDVAGISTNKRWASCQGLPDRGPDFDEEFFENWQDEDPDEVPNNFGYRSYYWHHALEDIKYGTIAAYLINNGDEDIDEPRARISIKPLHSRKKKNHSPFIHLEIEPFIYTDGSFGGRRECTFDHLPTTVLNSFKNVVQEWIDDANEILEKDVVPGTVYRKHPKVYNDGGTSYYEKPDPEKVVLEKSLEKLRKELSDFYKNGTELPYNVGDEIKLNENNSFIVIGKNHDLIYKPKDKEYNAITVMLKTNNPDNGIIRSDGIRGWINSEVRVVAKENVFNRLGSITTKKRTAGVSSGAVDDIMITHDNVFLLSVVEIFGDTKGVTFEGEGRQYEYFATNGVPDILKDSWLRSPYIANDTSFCAIDSNGELIPAEPTEDKKYIWCITF